MIKAYLVGIASYYEGEDIEIRYSIYEDERLIDQKSIMKSYIKPILVGQISLQVLLKDMYIYKDKEIEIILNDGSTYSVLEKISRPKNVDLLRMAANTRQQLNLYKRLELKNISGNHEAILDWDKKLKF